MAVVKRISGREILDSRGRPTVEGLVELESGEVGAASVPSGASTGKAEALELRDGDEKRYGGLGCRSAVAHVNGEIARALEGKKFETQAEFDSRLIELDGTENKSRLGANAILACSLAFARATALRRGIPLYAHLAANVGANARSLPRLTINLFSGGKHAGGQVEIQDVLMVPRAPSIDEGLAQAHAVFYAAAKLIGEKYQMRLLRADEGGLAPPVKSIEALFDDAVESIRRAGLRPGEDVALAVDVASSHFYKHGRYEIAEERLDSAAMIDRVARWAENWPIISVEDGLAEEDWANWPKLREKVAPKALVLGDDFLCTNPARIARAIAEKCASALLLKVNQIGTLTEAVEARRLAKAAGWLVTVSARSGETEDNWLADLAVAWGDQIKVGAITQSERLAKYNRLLAIEEETQWPINPWPARA
jgi:enolase